VFIPLVVLDDGLHAFVLVGAALRRGQGLMGIQLHGAATLWHDDVHDPTPSLTN